MLSGGSRAAPIQGIGAGFVPEILDRSVIDEVRTITERDAQRDQAGAGPARGAARRHLRGRVGEVALDVARELGPGKTVVTILCDTGERYFSSDEYFE